MLKIKKEIIFILAVLFGVFLFSFISFQVWIKVNSRPITQNEGKDFFIEIKKGDTLGSIVETLSEKKLIRSVFVAKYLWWVNKYDLKSGYYLINTKMSLSEILANFHKGREYLIKLTIPEGLTAIDIGEILRQLKDFQPIADSFLEAVKDKTILEKNKIPFPTADGYLFPSTYYLPKNISGQDLAEKMITTFFKKVNKDFVNLSVDKQKEVVILASIVEKEAVDDEDRPFIASVFLNRLKKNMPLESCATVIYAFELKGIDKKRLLYRDLTIESPYNTYVHKNLPPTPIANPGLKSLKAAMEQKNTDYLYFVYKGNGKHVFSKTLKEHMLNYRKYILHQNQRKKE